MCHGRLTDGLEPACVNACPESPPLRSRSSINSNGAAITRPATHPACPTPGDTISTTRITLPENAQATLERVDIETLRPEHPHWSLVWMTSLIQLSAGTLVAALLSHHDGPIALTLILALTAFTLNISVLHLGRPAYAWRALKMWRRSWLSREVLLFGLFFTTLFALTAASWLSALHPGLEIAPVLLALKVLAPTLGIAGILASAYIYLVPARPAWNTPHTPIDFILSAAVLGSAAAPVLINATTSHPRVPRTSCSRPPH